MPVKTAVNALANAPVAASHSLAAQFSIT